MVYKEENVVTNKKKHRKCPNVDNVLKPGTVPPDGGWGWMVVAAYGLNNLFCLSIILCFGMIFRDGFKQMEINALQTTTILSINTAVASFVGLSNGPLFRRYSYRQAACAGGFICAISIIALAFVKSYYAFLIFFSILYAIGKSVAMSANGLAVITYFKEKRQIAVGLAWTLFGVGSILIPQITAILMPIYGMSGTVLLFGGFAFNTLVSGLVLQPIWMHANKDRGYKSIVTAAEAENIKEDDKDTTNTVINETQKMLSMANVRQWDKLANLVEKRSSWSFRSQHLNYNEKQNGWQTTEVDDWKRKIASDPNLAGLDVVRKSFRKIDDDNNEADDCRRLHTNNNTTENMLRRGFAVSRQEVEEPEQSKSAWCTRAFRKFVVTFDLDLLRDCVFINLLIGISFAIFVEINFTFLTPYILLDFGLTHTEVATVISVLSGVDVFTRLVVSFATKRIGWSNRTFVLIGVGLSVLGRFTLAHVSTYYMILTAAVFCGIGEALTFVFTVLVIPDYVPLEKCPSAFGLTLMFKGIVSLTFGPMVGWIRDSCGNNTAMLYFLNVFSLLVLISWIVELWCCSWRRRRQQQRMEDPRA